VEENFKDIALYVAFAAEGGATLIVAFGICQAAFSLLRYAKEWRGTPGGRKRIWLDLAVWLVLALEFELASDIVRSAISPSWTDIGHLASIGVVRTLLSVFLDKDMEKYGES
jgi:uncharacterized membrane protein